MAAAVCYFGALYKLMGNVNAITTTTTTTCRESVVRL